MTNFYEAGKTVSITVHDYLKLPLGEPVDMRQALIYITTLQHTVNELLRRVARLEYYQDPEYVYDEGGYVSIVPYGQRTNKQTNKQGDKQ